MTIKIIPYRSIFFYSEGNISSTFRFRSTFPTSFLDNERFSDALLDSFPEIVNNGNPKPELPTPHKLGIIDKSSTMEISLTIFQTKLKISCQDCPNLVSRAYYGVAELLARPTFLVVFIEVTIKNNNSDLSRKNIRISWLLVLGYNTYSERLSICVADDLLCENFSSQAIHEGELVSWRPVLINQSSAQTVEQNKRYRKW